ncbi:MAG TPA: FliM/FliN family flagellar motor switch protein [Gaiellaceae bacterium]|nr:FliM/FliN family flagellar motor switch protein [Gaiellaceae bacterium]
MSDETESGAAEELTGAEPPVEPTAEPRADAPADVPAEEPVAGRERGVESAAEPPTAGGEGHSAPAAEPPPEETPDPFAGLDLSLPDAPESGLEIAAGVPGRQPRIRDIDFSRPTKFSQEHQRRIVRLHETFCRAIGTQLSAELRLPLEFQLISTTQMSWASATTELPAASLFGIMDVLPGSERALLACELPLLQYCLDRMLGGDGLSLPQRAELTEIELALSQRLMERLTAQLSLAWSESVGTTFELRHVDTQITNVQLVTPSEAVLGLTVEVKLERGSSTFTVIFPHVAVEPILEQLSVGHFGERRQVDYDSGPLREALLPIDVEMRVDVGSLELSVDQALRLHPGQLIEFGPIEAGVQLFGGDTATHVCRPGKIGEFRAVEILSRTVAAG